MQEAIHSDSVEETDNWQNHKVSKEINWWNIFLRSAFNKFPDFFVQASKIDVDSWKFSMLLLYILWDDWSIFMISGTNQQLQQQLEYTLLKPDYHSWWISKMQSGREDTLEERYAIKFCFKLVKNTTETYGMLQTTFRPSCMNRAWVFEWHKRFIEGREPVRDDERCGRSKESIHHSWLIKGLGLRLLCWGFKGVQEEIPSEDVSTLQIRSVAFPPGQCTSQQLHPCHISFQTFLVWALLLIVHSWNSSPLRSTLLRLQCTCFTVPTTSGRPHGSPLAWACQWPSSKPLSFPQLSHNDSLWAWE